MMMKYLALSALLLTSCVTASRVKTEKDGKIHTIGYYTGTMLDDGTYQSQFTNGAEKLCGKQYKVLERTRTPSTLDGQELEGSKFYWVIACE
jgi:hypothetical protein